MWCSNGQIWSLKWPRSRSVKPEVRRVPWAPSALPGDLNEGDAIVLQKKWRFEGHQFAKHHAPSLYTINRPQKFRGISYPLEVWPCFMYQHIFHQLFHLLVQAISKQIQALLKWKTQTATGFPTTSGLGKSCLQDTASSRNLFTTHESVNVAVICCPVLSKLIYKQFVL